MKYRIKMLTNIGMGKFTLLAGHNYLVTLSGAFSDLYVVRMDGDVGLLRDDEFELIDP